MFDTTATLDSLQSIDVAHVDMVTGGFSWSEMGRAAAGGAIAGGVGGAVAGAITGPGVTITALGGAIGGGVSTAVYNAGQQLDYWK